MSGYIPSAVDFIIENFDMLYSKFFMLEFSQKLGIRRIQKGDVGLITSMYETLRVGGFDWTNFFRRLHTIPIPVTAESSLEGLSSEIDALFSLRAGKAIKCKVAKPKFGKERLEKIREVLRKNPELLKMIGQDPEVIERELRKDEEYSKLMLSQDSDVDAQTRATLESWLLEYRLRLYQDFEQREDEQEGLEEFQQARVLTMLKKNPKFVLRNHLAEKCIQKAEDGDYSMVDGLLTVLESPFDEHEDAPKEWSDVPPMSALDICVSCSS